MLTNHGLFTAHIESIRVLPVGDASAGMSITAVELVPTSHPLIGTVDDAGYEYASAGVRSRPAGYTILPSRLAGRPGSAELLVRSEVTQPGEWRYRGYEVVYRSGFVRHRMVVEAELQACTPAGGGCLDQLP